MTISLHAQDEVQIICPEHSCALALSNAPPRTTAPVLAGSDLGHSRPGIGACAVARLIALKRPSAHDNKPLGRTRTVEALTPWSDTRHPEQTM
jgi:hypothetical protein